jgi:hypothetical protein
MHCDFICYIVPHFSVLHCAVLYCAVLHCTVLSCTILYSIAQSYTALYSNVMFLLLSRSNHGHQVSSCTSSYLTILHLISLHFSFSFSLPLPLLSAGQLLSKIPIQDLADLLVVCVGSNSSVSDGTSSMLSRSTAVCYSRSEPGPTDWNQLLKTVKICVYVFFYNFPSK